MIKITNNIRDHNDGFTLWDLDVREGDQTGVLNRSEYWILWSNLVLEESWANKCGISWVAMIDSEGIARVDNIGDQPKLWEMARIGMIVDEWQFNYGKILGISDLHSRLGSLRTNAHRQDPSPDPHRRNSSSNTWAVVLPRPDLLIDSSMDERIGRGASLAVMILASWNFEGKSIAVHEQEKQPLGAIDYYWTW